MRGKGAGPSAAGDNAEDFKTVAVGERDSGDFVARNGSAVVFHHNMEGGETEVFDELHERRSPVDCEGLPVGFDGDRCVFGGHGGGAGLWHPRGLDMVGDERLVEVFPHRFISLRADHGGDGGGAAFVGDVELFAGLNVFCLLP